MGEKIADLCFLGIEATMKEKYTGLSENEAKEKLNQFGSNKLPEKLPPSGLKIFLSQMKSPLVYILLAAGVVTFILGHTSDTIIIVAAVLVNTVLGFVQEKRANNALFALKQLVHPLSEVIREGQLKKIELEFVVPGDICVLNSGDKVPADGHLVEASRFFVTESVLTGESLPVEKSEGDEVFMGTIVSGGRGFMKVESTGENTQIGKIALQVQEPSEETPLKKQLSVFSKQLTVLVLILTFFVFFVGVLLQKDIVEIFKTSVALAVSAIPEGLLVGLTVVLAIGMQRILKKKGLVRNLVSAETLGGVTTICVDKTGTLTEGKMKVTDAYGDRNLLSFQSIVANDLDDPMVLATYDWAVNNQKAKVDLKKYERLDSIPFSSSTRFFASLNKFSKDSNMMFVNGAPEFLLKWANLSKSEKMTINEIISESTGKGKRLVGMARKKVGKDKVSLNDKDVMQGLEWVGILVLTDPVRENIKETFEKTKKAGIKVMVITGDYFKTANYVMNEIGLSPNKDSIILGSEIEKMTEKSLQKRIEKFEDVMLFARTTPDQKLKIVSALKQNGEVVAMMGDGVNDAPALKKADIGIVVDNATDVSKESADLVLLDSNFATIVDAVEEGRGIYDNLRKIILYLMSDAFSEIIAVVGSMLVGGILSKDIPLPVTAVQILWINLASDGFPHLALTADPKNPDIMTKKPRKRTENIVSSWMKTLIGIVSIFSGISTLIAFIFVLSVTNDEILARSVAFVLLGVNSLFYVYSIRTISSPIWKSNPFNNKWLILAVISGFVLQLLPFVTSIGRSFFGVVLLPLNYWILVFGVSLLIIVLIEITKIFLRQKFE